jgi:hypothetical protein
VEGFIHVEQVKHVKHTDVLHDLHVLHGHSKEVLQLVRLKRQKEKYEYDNQSCGGCRWDSGERDFSGGGRADAGRDVEDRLFVRRRTAGTRP